MSEETLVHPTPLHQKAGGDDQFILAWGRQNAALAIFRWLLLILFLITLVQGGVIAYLAYRNEQKQVWCFVKDGLGNVVQADPGAFLRAGESRTDVDVKAFVKRWIQLGYVFTPLDVNDQARAAMLLVEPKARSVVKAGLRFGERSQAVMSGRSGRILDDDKDPARQPQIVIQSRKPLNVMVQFQRFYRDQNGADLAPVPVLATFTLKEVPRTPDNPAGLTIVDAHVSENL